MAVLEIRLLGVSEKAGGVSRASWQWREVTERRGIWGPLEEEQQAGAKPQTSPEEDPEPQQSPILLPSL